MSHPFDLMCRNHPERVIDERGRWDCFCTECYINAWNAGARQADATWADRPRTRYQDERAPDGRSIYADHQGYYRRNDSERNDV